MRRRPHVRRRPARIAVLVATTLAVVVGAAFGLAHAAAVATDVEAVEVHADAAARRDGSTGAIRLPIRADLVGATWRGAGAAIELRARVRGGAWSRWVELHAGDDGPDPGSAEARRASRSIGRQRSVSSPVWVGAADEVQVRRARHEPRGEQLRDVRVWALNASGTATRRERLATRLRADAAWVLGEPAHAQPLAPGIRSRALWKASAPAADPWYADSVRGVVIHHTAETNRYSCSQVPAMLRGIQRYHMRANGWNDIGYNFLVDRCGGVWEGRGGGIREPVGGAHTAGFNTSTSGIALMGTHGGVAPTHAAQQALRRLVAWRLDVAHVKPTGSMILTAASGDKFASGSRVVVRAVSGHRDLFPTSCPGALEYRQLARLARDAWITGGAKVANITSSYARRAPDDALDPSLARVDVRAIASHADMYVTLRIERASTGEVLHTFASTGTLAKTSWTVPAELAVPYWDVRVAVNGARAAGQRARAALVPLEATTPDPALVITTPPPAELAVGGDPSDDYVRVQYTLGLDYRIGAWLHDPITGDEVAVLREPAYVGTTTTPVEFAAAIPPEVDSGTYELRIGLPADTAAGRSMHRSSLAITRS